jgi:hypothetical protein
MTGVCRWTVEDAILSEISCEPDGILGDPTSDRWRWASKHADGEASIVTKR